jgi:hypothetical protein
VFIVVINDKKNFLNGEPLQQQKTKSFIPFLVSSVAEEQKSQDRRQSGRERR